MENSDKLFQTELSDAHFRHNMLKSLEVDYQLVVKVYLASDDLADMPFKRFMDLTIAEHHDNGTIYDSPEDHQTYVSFLRARLFLTLLESVK